MSRLAIALLLAIAPLTHAAGPGEAKADKKDDKKPSTIAHIKLSGSMGEQAPSTDPLGSSLTEPFKARMDRLKKASTDKDVHAIILEVNGVSAGWGKVYALSHAIAQARKAGKKVHAYLEGGSLKD